MKGMFGGRLPESPEQSYNILTVVDHMDKLFKGTRASYDRLSEFTHPNYSGAMGSYSYLDKKKHLAYLGKARRDVPVEVGLITLVACLDLFVDYYNSVGHTLKAINDSYEHNARPSSQ
jgi:hypothetical protein